MSRGERRQFRHLLRRVLAVMVSGKVVRETYWSG